MSKEVVSFFLKNKGKENCFRHQIHERDTEMILLLLKVVGKFFYLFFIAIVIRIVTQ